MPNQAVIPWASVYELPIDGTVAWTSPSLLSTISRALPFPVIAAPQTPAPGVPRLVVVGGGSLIDHAKLWKHHQSPKTWLCAIPSLWGSGAEASPVAVETKSGRKVPLMDAALLPDARSNFLELADTIPPKYAFWGFGDVWAHALEGFLSPLSSDELRQEFAKLLVDLLAMPLVSSNAWFELSARACNLQSRTGVGLIHGIAHELEPHLNGYGHARLCTTLLWPVFRFNASRSPKVEALCTSFEISMDAIGERLQLLFQESDFSAILPSLVEHWGLVIRNPLSRINCAVVRPDAISYFQRQEFAL